MLRLITYKLEFLKAGFIFAAKLDCVEPLIYYFKIILTKAMEKDLDKTIAFAVDLVKEFLTFILSIIITVMVRTDLIY